MTLPQVLRRVAVVGYSTRSLAEAAAGLGLEVVAIDAFCDVDTRRVADCIAIDNWPHGIVDAIERSHVDGVLLGGGMENLLELHGAIEAIAPIIGPIIGPTKSQMQMLRDPALWQELASVSPGMRFPKTIMASISTDSISTESLAKGESQSDRWLVKLNRSAGGLGVVALSSDSLADDARLELARIGNGCYLQEFIRGRSLGVSFLVSPVRAEVLGVAESLAEQDWWAPAPFQFRGALSPIDLSLEQLTTLESFGRSVSVATAYQGVLQADFIEDSDGELWLLEINPRWTASMELFGATAGVIQGVAPGVAAGAEFLERHIRAFTGKALLTGKVASSSAVASWSQNTGSFASVSSGLPPVEHGSRRDRKRYLAKAILYAPSPLRFDAAGYAELIGLWQQRQMFSAAERQVSGGERGSWRLADVPDRQAAERGFGRGEPVATVLAEVEFARLHAATSRAEEVSDAVTWGGIRNRLVAVLKHAAEVVWGRAES